MRRLLEMTAFMVLSTILILLMFVALSGVAKWADDARCSKWAYTHQDESVRFEKQSLFDWECQVEYDGKWISVGAWEEVN